MKLMDFVKKHCFQDPTVRGVTTINPRASKTDIVIPR